MDISQTLLLGVVQGVTEWLPISSEGMNTLILTQLYNVPSTSAVLLSLWLHLGTLAASVIYFRRELWRLFTTRDKTLRFLIISTIVSVIVAAPYALFGLERWPLNGSNGMIAIGIFLLITGTLQFTTKKKEIHERQPNLADALLAGVGQGLAIIPGLSRSGLTISLLLLRRHTPSTSLKLSFLMSIPAVIIAAVWSSVNGEGMVSAAAVLGLIAAFIVGIAAITAMFKLAERVNFGWFCYIIGLLSIIAGLLVN